MRNKKTGAANSCESITKNLFTNQSTTPFKIGQFFFSGKTEIFTQPSSARRGRSRCYGCLQWFKALKHFGIWFRPNLSPIQYGLCQKCFRSLQILPPNLQRNFADKCAKNLENALEVKNDG